MFSTTYHLDSFSVVRLGWPIGNSWLVPFTDIGPVLIDTSHRVLWPALVAGLKEHGLFPDNVAAVLLTHRHCDHAGNAAYLKEHYGTPIYAQRLDAEVVSGKRPAPALDVRFRLDGVMS